MHFHSVWYRSPAKINLSLDILKLRKDGYHELQSVVHCIGLYDRLKFEFYCPAPPLLRFSCNVPSLETDDNLCLRAVRDFLKATEYSSGMESWRGAQIYLEKNIPFGAGLGGGSGNAAAVLLALLHRFDRSLDERALMRVASKLGADVPLFLRGGCMLMEGIGEKLKPLPAIEGHVVLIAPNRGASTPEVYRCFDELNAVSHKSTPEMLNAVKKKDLVSVARNLGNDLRQAAQNIGVDVEVPNYLLKKYGAWGAQMSGSGASSFGLFPNEQTAQAAAHQIREDKSLPSAYRVFTAPLIATGVEREKPDV